MPKRGMGGALEPLTISAVQVYHRPHRELHTISSAEPLRVWQRLTGSYEHLSAALSVCSVVMRILPAEVPAPDVYDFLHNALTELDGSPESAAFTTSVYARLRLAELLGFGLPTNELLRQDLADRSALFFDLENGSLNAHYGFQVSSRALAILTQGATISGLVDAHDRVEVEAFLSAYFTHHVGKRL